MSDLINDLPWFKKMEVLRTIKWWSQEETAEKCCTGQKAYWGWEKGNIYPRKNSRRAIAHAFGIKEEEIFGKEK